MAKIVLSVQTNTTSAQSGIAQLKKQVLELSNALDKISVGDDLTKKVNALAKSYSQMTAKAATSVKKTQQAQQVTKKSVSAVETLRKNIYNLSITLKTLETQYEAGAFKRAPQRVKELKAEIEELSKAQQKHGKLSKAETATLTSLQKKFKKLTADISKFKDIGVKTTTDPLVSSASNTITKIRKEYARLTQQIETLQKYYKKGTFDTQIKELKQLEPQVKTLADAQDNNVKLGKQEAETAVDVSDKLKKVAVSTQEAAASNKNYHGTLRDLISGFAKFQLSAMLVMKPLQLIQNALSSINETLIDTENAVVEIKRVLNDTGVTNGQISDDLYEIAQNLGTTFDTVSELAAEFAKNSKEGTSWSDILEEVTVAVQAMNVAELDSEEATEGLIAIMSQFEIEADDLINVVDILNKTADNAAVTTEELLTALQKTGSYAHEANLSLEDTVAIITALSESTAASGQNIGNALKSLLAYSSKASSLKTFASLSDDTARVVGEYERGAATILEVWQAVSAKMGSLSAEQATLLEQWSDDSGLETELGSELSDVYDTMKGVYDTAGTYRKNYFIALLNNMDGVLEAQENIKNAEGYTAKEQATYMETYEAKLNTLQDHWEEIANDEQGILWVKKTLVDIGDALLTVVESVGGLKTVLLAAATAFSAIFSSKVGQIAKQLQSALKGIGSKFAELVKSVKDKSFGAWFKNQLSNLNKFKKATEAARKAQEAQTAATEAQAKADELAAVAKQLNNSKTATAAQKTKAATAAQEAQTAATEAQTTATEAQAAATTALGAAISSVIGIITIAVAATSLIVNIANNAKQAYEDWVEETGEGAAEATEGLEKLSDKIHATVNAYDEYGEKISTLRGILDDETSSTENITEAQKQLVDIQNDLASKYNGDYADSIDLVNGKLETQLSLLESLDDREQTESEVKTQVTDYLKEYADKIYEAKKYENDTLNTANTSDFYYSLASSLGWNTAYKLFGDTTTFKGTTLKERLAILEEAYDNAVLEAGGDYTSETAAALRSVINDLKGDTYDEVQKLLYGDEDGEGLAKLPIEVLESFANGKMTYDEFIKKLEEAEGVQQDLNEGLNDTEKKLEYISDGWDDIIEKLKERKELEEQTLSLEEKQLAVEEAKQALEKAKSEKVMRFNYETMNFEVVSDEKEVASAEADLQDAVDALNEYVEEQAWDDMLDELESGNATNESILTLLTTWAAKSSEENPEWYNKYLEWLAEDSGVDLRLAGNSSDNSYDNGGVASGLGLMAKATAKPETVNSPELTAKILSPTSNAQFDSYVKNMGIMFENAQKYATVPPQMISTVGNTTNNTYNNGATINGVQLNTEQSNLLAQVLNIVGLVQKS